MWQYDVQWLIVALNHIKPKWKDQQMRKVRVDGRTLDQIYGSHFPSFPSML